MNQRKLYLKLVLLHEMFSFNSESFLRYFHFNSVDDSVYTNQDQSRPLMNLYFALFTELEKDTYDL